jgi:hypothetical protein
VFSPAVSETAEALFQLNPALMSRNSPILTRAVDHVRFPGEELEIATAEVMSENGIPRRWTPDVMAVWKGKPSSSR